MRAAHGVKKLDMLRDSQSCSVVAAVFDGDRASCRQHASLACIARCQIKKSFLPCTPASHGANISSIRGHYVTHTERKFHASRKQAPRYCAVFYSEFVSVWGS